MFHVKDCQIETCNATDLHLIFSFFAAEEQIGLDFFPIKYY